jgi:hypothetical protein
MNRQQCLPSRGNEKKKEKRFVCIQKSVWHKSNTHIKRSQLLRIMELVVKNCREKGKKAEKVEELPGNYEMKVANKDERT